MDAVSRSILGYQVSDNRGVGPCILAMRMAFREFKDKLPENFKFIADGYSAYLLAAQQFFIKKGNDFKFDITQVIGLTNDDAVSAEFRPFKQLVERLNRTFKASYRVKCGFDNFDGASYDLALWVAYYNFLRPHSSLGYRVLVRHYDASRKNCPASMSKNGWALLATFKKRLTENEEDLTMAQYDELKKEIGSIRTHVDKLKNKMIYAWVDDNMPDWAKPTVTKLMRKGYLKGDDEGKLNLDDNMLRILVINDRAGIYGE